MNSRRLSAKVAHNRFDWTQFKMCCIIYCMF